MGSIRKSEFSIKKIFDKKEEENEENINVVEQNLPENHFSNTDLQEEWIRFLKDLSKKNPIIFNAIKGFNLSKIDENKVEVVYSSDTAKKEFENIEAEFFNAFKNKVKNFKIEVVYRKDITLKQEILTKRKIFDKFVEINPVLKDLEDLMKFDFS